MNYQSHCNLFDVCVYIYISYGKNCYACQHVDSDHSHLSSKNNLIGERNGFFFPVRERHENNLRPSFERTHECLMYFYFNPIFWSSVFYYYFNNDRCLPYIIYERDDFRLRLRFCFTSKRASFIEVLLLLQRTKQTWTFYFNRSKI